MQRKFRYTLTLLCTVMVLLPVWFTAADAVRNNNGAWRVLDVGATKPEIRKHHTMVYDPVYDRVILYAGETEAGGHHHVLNDLWKLDLGGSNPQWTELDDLPNAPSAGRHGHSAGFGGGKMYVVTGLLDFAGTFASDCLVLNLGATPSWGNAFSHPVGSWCTDDFLFFNSRSHSAAAYVGSELFFMGGRGSFGEPQFDTWGYNGSDWNWKSGYLGGGDVEHDHLPCLGAVPDARYWHSMISAAGKIVVFGGVYDTTPISNTFVSANGVNWTYLGSAPSEQYNFTRAFHAAVYDAVGGRMVVVGGYLATDLGQIVSDVTALPVPQAGGQWSLLAPTGTAPGGISEHAAVYDSARDRVIVFGGVSTGGVLRPNDTHVLEFADQTPPATAFIGGGRGTTTATISWTAPGDDGTTGTAVEYDLRTSPTIINAGNFSQAAQISTPAPQPAGSPECVLLSGLTPGQKNYYALKTRDAVGNWSALSNVISITQRTNGIEVECSGSGLTAGTTPTPKAGALEYRIRGSNPSSGLTTLFVGIPDNRAGESMEISIFDVTGKRIRTSVQRTATPGEAEFTWDHRTASGARVPGGVYFARLKLGSETRTQKVISTIAR